MLSRSAIKNNNRVVSRPEIVVVYVNDLNSTCEKVLLAGGSITREIFSFPGGRRFHYEEPAGTEQAVWSDK